MSIVMLVLNFPGWWHLWLGFSRHSAMLKIHNPNGLPLYPCIPASPGNPYYFHCINLFQQDRKRECWCFIVPISVLKTNLTLKKGDGRDISIHLGKKKVTDKSERHQLKKNLKEEDRGEFSTMGPSDYICPLVLCLKAEKLGVEIGKLYPFLTVLVLLC